MRLSRALEAALLAATSPCLRSSAIEGAREAISAGFALASNQLPHTATIQIGPSRIPLPPTLPTTTTTRAYGGPDPDDCDPGDCDPDDCDPDPDDCDPVDSPQHLCWIEDSPFDLKRLGNTVCEGLPCEESIL